MLRLRIISALIMAPLVILGIFTLDTTQFASVLALIMMGAAWEWSALIALPTLAARLMYLIFTALVLSIVWHYAQLEWLVQALLGLSLVWWLFALAWISRPEQWQRVTPLSTLVKSILGFGLISVTWLSLVVLHSRVDQGPVWVLFVLMLIWIADSGAYFSGRMFGRTKLAPKVSPGKTWEGVYGALLATAIFAAAFSSWKDYQGAMKTSFILVCIITVLFSIEGDLFESLMKRHRGMKDSGSLIPGHGGLLDRMDSMLSAVPIFLLGMYWVEL